MIPVPAEAVANTKSVMVWHRQIMTAELPLKPHKSRTKDHRGAEALLRHAVVLYVFNKGGT